MESTVTYSKINSLCEIHKTYLFTCSYDNCTESSFCKFCCIESKEGVKHFYEHFDYVKHIGNSLPSFTACKDDEFFIEINKAYTELMQNINKSLENIFDSILNQKAVMNTQVCEVFSSNYEEVTTSFQGLVKSLTEKMSNINTQDSKAREEITKIKNELDVKLELINDPKSLTNNLDDFFENMMSKFKKLKIADILENKFNFTNKKNLNINFGWDNGSSIIKVISRGRHYWYTRSQELLEGNFTCRIAIRQINNSSAGSFWNYAVGLARPVIQNEESYFSDCVLLQSNGYIATAFSGSGSGRQIFTTNWKVGDEIIVKRDEEGLVYFGINDDQNLVQAFDNVKGSMKVVMGFRSILNNGDEFEMIELYKDYI